MGGPTLKICRLRNPGGDTAEFLSRQQNHDVGQCDPFHYFNRRKL